MEENKIDVEEEVLEEQVEETNADDTEEVSVDA